MDYRPCAVLTLVASLVLTGNALGQTVKVPSSCVVHPAADLFPSGYGVLGSSGCRLADGTPAEVYSFAGAAGALFEFRLIPRDWQDPSSDQPSYKAPMLTIVPPASDASAAPFIAGNPEGEHWPSFMTLRHVLTAASR